MRVLLLCHKSLVPPLKKQKFERAENALWRTEYYVAQSLLRLGHEVDVCGVNRSLSPLKNKIRKSNPDVVFNLLEEFDGEGLLEPFPVSYMESIRQPFTGSGSLGLILAKNKIAAKCLLRASGVLTPGHHRYPKIVKLLDEESSRGISDRSIVMSSEEEMRQAKKLMSRYKCRTFSEEYIEGRELHVGVIRKGNRLLVTPVWETVFGEKRGAPIISEKAKWDFAYRKRVGIQLQAAKGLPTSIRKTISEAAGRGFRALKLSGYARVDIRLTSDNRVYVLEVNPNPDVAWGDEFAECVRSMGLGYDEMITLFLQQALRNRL